MGHPPLWAAVVNTSPIAEVPEKFNGKREWAATPAHRAFAFSVLNFWAILFADRIALLPKRITGSRCLGKCKGAKRSDSRYRQSRITGSNICLYVFPSSPKDSAVSSREL